MTTETMRAAVVRDGSPTIEVIDIPRPVPRAGEALIEVIACGVCHTDLHLLRDEVAFPRPAVLGHEVSGRVVALGDGGGPRNLAVDDLVVGSFIMPCTSCDACRAGRDDLCSTFFEMNRVRGTLYDGESRLSMADESFLAMYSMGGFAEYAVVPLSALTRIPKGLDPESACILGCAILTAYSAVNRAAEISTEHTVAIVGVGGVGSGLVAFAKAAGAERVIAVDVAADKLERARALGATHVVDAAKVDPVAAVRAITADGVDVAFEALGLPATVRQTVQMLRPGGRMVAIGIAPNNATADVEMVPLVRRGLHIVGSFGGRVREDLPVVARLAADGVIDLSEIVSRRFALEDVQLAFDELDAGRIGGRAIIAMRVSA